LAIEAYEVIIVGSGPAGLSAGIFVARQRTKCLLISKDLGGQLNLIPKLENYPGTIMSSGPLLARTFENQYLTFNGEMVFDTVEQIDEYEKGEAADLVGTSMEKESSAVSMGQGVEGPVGKDGVGSLVCHEDAIGAPVIENEGAITKVPVEKVGGVDIKKEDGKSSSQLKIKTLRSEYLTKAVILAPGKVPNNLGVENETKFQNKGVHYCGVLNNYISYFS
jgi:thioredoxin reductase